MTRLVTKNENELIERLKAIADELGIDAEDIENPDFTESNRYTGWTYYVNRNLQPLWDEMPLEMKVGILIACEKVRDGDNAMAW